MNNTPTAEEYIQNYNKEYGTTYVGFEHFMVEFAKLHVKAALEAAAEKAVAKEDSADYGTGSIWVDKQSILNAYSENLIK